MQVRMRMHRGSDGACWADSEDLPGYTALGADFHTVMGLVGEALDAPTLLGLTLRPLVDVRWQWCDDPDRGFMAIGGPGADMFRPGQPAECPCSGLVASTAGGDGEEGDHE
jgi:hypothetical protein